MFSDMLFTAACPLKDLQRFVVFKIISIVCTVLSFDDGKRIADVFEDFIKIFLYFPCGECGQLPVKKRQKIDSGEKNIYHRKRVEKEKRGGTESPELSEGSVKEITKLEKTSLSDFKLHTEECQGQAFFLEH